jgi:hypothetical protein
VTVVVTPSARERFTPANSAPRMRTIHRTRAAIRERPNRPLEAAVYRLGARLLIVCEEPESGVVTLATLEEQAAAERKRGVCRLAPPAPRFTLPVAAGRVLTNSTSRNSTRRRGVQ